MIKRVWRKAMGVWLCGVLFSSMAPAVVPANEDGRAVAQQIYDRDTGKNSYAKIDMILTNAQGEERIRSMVIAVKDYNRLNKRYIRFTEPASLDGTAFLAWENADRSDDQFLFLPELGRVRRVVSTQKDRSFANSDFTFEDLERRKVDHDTHTIIRTEACLPYTCVVLESVPRDEESSQYSKLVSWVIKDIWIPKRTEYYDKRARVAKRWAAYQIEKVDGIWTVLDSAMHDVKKNHRTRMRILEVRYNRGVADQVFTEAYLQKSR